MNKILELKDVSLTYQTLKDEITAIKDLSFYCNKGDFVSIIGPSGCGKTSILSLIAGLIKQSSGTINLFFENSNGIEQNERLGYMLQKDELFPWRTIEKNVYLPLEIKGKLNASTKSYAESLLKKYGLFEFKNNYPDQLSGGMRQRAALIRTLVPNPELLLLDEPFSALDFQTRLSVCDDVYKIIKAEKKTAVLVTHDISEAISMSDIIIVLSGRPAKVKSIYKPNLIADTPLQRRECKDFSSWFEKLWKELN